MSDYIFTLAALHDILENTETTKDELYELLRKIPSQNTIEEFMHVHDCDGPKAAKIYDLLNNYEARNIIAEVELLTHSNNISFKEYIDRIFQDDSIKREGGLFGDMNRAKYVKLADRIHNLSTIHLCGNPEKIQRKVWETEEYIMPWRDKHKECESLFAQLENGYVVRWMGKRMDEYSADDLKNILSEVYATVTAMGEYYKNRISEYRWDKILAMKSDEYHPFIDENKQLIDQNVTYDTISFIAVLHKDYWCDTKEEWDRIVAIIKEAGRSFLGEKMSEKVTTSDLIDQISHCLSHIKSKKLAYELLDEIIDKKGKMRVGKKSYSKCLWELKTSMWLNAKESNKESRSYSVREDEVQIIWKDGKTYKFVYTFRATRTNVDESEEEETLSVLRVDDGKTCVLASDTSTHFSR